MTEPLCNLSQREQTMLLAALHTTKGRLIRKDMPPELREEIMGRVDPLITRIERCMDPTFPDTEKYHTQARNLGRELAKEPEP